MAERFGILIGINDYTDGPLQYCVKDVAAIEEVLVERCMFQKENIYKVISHIGDSRKEILGEFRQALSNIKITFESNVDSLFFFFAGHGSFHNDKSYIYLHDIQYSIEDIYTEINDVLSPEIQIYVIDACESGGKVISRDLKGRYSLLEKYESNSQGTMLLFACGTNQFAFEHPELEHGLLTNAFISGIQNDELYDKDGILTPSVLQDYVTKETAKYSEFQQIPVFENRISGVYPLAIIKNEGISDVHFELTANAKYLRTNYVITNELRTELLNVGKSIVDKKMASLSQSLIQNHPDLYEIENIETYEEKRFLEWYENIDVLSEKLFKVAKQDMNLPLNDVFNEIVIRDNTDPFGLSYLTRTERREYELNLNVNSVKFKINIFRAKNVTESSFGYGLIIYQTKWGISIAKIEFRLEWDGHSDRILKDIIVGTFKFRLDENFETKLDEIKLNEQFSFISKIDEWNSKRLEEINSFLDSTL